MALVISFVPDPIKAVTEMVRVVRPGGWVAAYMWDLPGGGIPIEPMLRALKSLDIAVALPGIEVSRRDNMRAGSAIDRYARNPHPGFLLRLRRFLAVVQCTGGAKRPAATQDVAVRNRTTERAVARATSH